MSIALDTMGTDNGVGALVKGALNAIDEFGLEIILVGDEQEIKKHLSPKDYRSSKLSIVHAEQEVLMEEPSASAVRFKKHSSIRVAIDLHKVNQVQAVVSAGNTGAVMATAKFVLNTVKGIKRPAIAVNMPSSKDNFVMLDAGATVDCKPKYLLHFGFMGEAYSNIINQVTTPRVALLSNGEEDAKGNSLVKESHKLLKNSTLNFIGNIEPKKLQQAKADVVVCDGFVGNLFLKAAESTFDQMNQMIKVEAENSLLAKFGYLFGMRRVFSQIKKKYDYHKVGAAPLLGIDGVVLISHGSAGPAMIKHALKQAQDCVDLQLTSRIANTLEENLLLNFKTSE